MNRRRFIRSSLAGVGYLSLAPASVSAYQVVDIKGSGKVAGVIRFQGKPPRPKKVKFSGDCAYCRRFDLREEHLLVSRKGGLQNVVVSLEGIAKGKPIPQAMPVMAEKRCTFSPHVLTIQQGAKLLLHNLDPVLNTFHAIALPTGRTLFNIGTPRKDQKVYRRIRKTGVIQMRCDVHPWEEGFIVAFNHPYHTVTDKDGAFLIEDILPGTYTIKLWHEKLGVRQQKIEIKSGQSTALNLSFSASGHKTK